jgi:arsenate reductase (glutaredoxin)
MALTVYHYKNCSTCRKALKFLEKQGVKFDPIDIVTKPPSVTELRRALKHSGQPLAKLFNTSGQSYRDGNFASRLPEMSEREALDALAADGKLIKRPLILDGEFAFFGFDEGVYEKRYG